MMGQLTAKGMLSALINASSRCLKMLDRVYLDVQPQARKDFRCYYAVMLRCQGKYERRAMARRRRDGSAMATPDSVDMVDVVGTQSLPSVTKMLPSILGYDESKRDQRVGRVPASMASIYSGTAPCMRVASRVGRKDPCTSVFSRRLPPCLWSIARRRRPRQQLPEGAHVTDIREHSALV
jgi:hypothetical protein